MFWAVLNDRLKNPKLLLVISVSSLMIITWTMYLITNKTFGNILLLVIF